ncbi:hypothetical protein SG34_030890 [Thalassomonas viridans]|uniref:ParB/Sulfiredoxin domain-containing protein n=1 Tax=Thalassomonas viridans TaxID=137584 RepID=A0AAE9ZEV6_9GAMM|nr:ParB/Srx family N-terminal domain-containing protein [Thalassomonas viridans]WDE09173.1 hypothetical protein SG34_030890 [Thalassomonas viridans]
MNDLKYEQLLISSLNNQEVFNAESFTYQSVFLSSVVPDLTNARFLPAIFIEDEHAKLFVSRKITKKQLVDMYHAEDHVLIGKSCMINCLKYNSPDWKKANKNIESIIELGNNISVSELIQTPTIYPVGDSKYQVLTGHRRFFALVYANGYGSASQFKVYEEKPLLAKVKQFQENASRDDLSQYGKLVAFLSATTEIDALNHAKIKAGLKKLTVKETATNLGISMGAYDNYNVLTRYTCVIDAYESGLSLPFIKTKKIVLEVEAQYKTQHGKSVLNVTDKKNISEEITNRLFNKKQPVASAPSFKIKPFKSSQAIKTLLTKNIIELNTGVDWNDVDWEDHIAVSKALSTVVEYLENS